MHVGCCRNTGFYQALIHVQIILQFFFLFKASSTPNMGSELMTQRSRAKRSILTEPARLLPSLYCPSGSSVKCSNLPLAERHAVWGFPRQTQASNLSPS